MFSRENITQAIYDLQLPIDEYIIVGGGALAAHGLRQTADIDIVCTENLYKNLEENGWPQKLRPDGKPSLKKNDIEVYLEVNAKDFQPTFKDLKNREKIIDGIPYISLSDARSFKKAYGREKDLADIKLIEDFLAQNNAS